MASLSGATIASTFKSLLKLAGNTDDLLAGGSTAVQVMTGDGENTPIFLNTDRVGIGTDAPDCNLHIQESAVSGHAAIDGNAVLILEEDNAHYIEFLTGRNSEVGMLFTTTTTADDAAIRFHAGNATVANAYIKFDVANDERMRIEGDGNVGIGTSSPETSLHIYKSQASEVPLLTIENASGSGDASIQFNQTGVENWTIGLDASDDFFRISRGAALSSNQYLTIDDSGNVGIGTTAPAAPLHISKEIANNGVLAFFEYFTDDNAVDANDIMMRLEFADDSTEDGTPLFMSFEDANSRMAHIQWDDDNSTVFADLSDYRYKSNIEPMGSSLSDINKLKPSSFYIRQASKKAYGFIAHELDEVYPSMVTGKKDAMKTKVTPAVKAVEAKDAVLDDNGNILEEAVEAVTAVAEKTEEVIDPQSIAYSKLIPFMIKAIQELSAKVEALENA